MSPYDTAWDLSRCLFYWLQGPEPFAQWMEYRDALREAIVNGPPLDDWVVVNGASEGSFLDGDS